jgi:hypothetical protein
VSRPLLVPTSAVRAFAAEALRFDIVVSAPKGDGEGAAARAALRCAAGGVAAGLAERVGCAHFDWMCGLWVCGGCVGVGVGVGCGVWGGWGWMGVEVSTRGVCELMVWGERREGELGVWEGVLIDLERRWIGRQRRGIRRAGQWIVCW